VPPKVDISDKKFVFADCPVNDHLDMLMTVKNLSELLPIDYEVDPVAHFHFRPQTGTLLPLQSRNIVITFAPKQACVQFLVQAGSRRVLCSLRSSGRGCQLGSFSNMCSLRLLGGSIHIPFRVSGLASSTVQKAKIIEGGT